MSMNCYKCQKEVVTTDKLGFRDDCPWCRADLHVCLACKFYDVGSYNDCKESQADRVVDKEKANFCEYFQYSESASSGGLSPADEAKRKLAELFKR